MSNGIKTWVNRELLPSETAIAPKPSAASLAAEANFSVAQFYRRFLRKVGQSPLRLKRRLLLERAAFELSTKSDRVTDIALRAQFESFEGFSRAFRRAYGVSPRQYRSLGATEYRLDLKQSIHFAPTLTSEAQRQGAFTLNLLDRLFGAHYVSMKLILDRCESLSEAQLDQEIETYYDPLPWMTENQSIRSLLRHIIGNGSPWPGVEPQNVHDTTTLSGLRAALEESYPRLMALVASHEQEGLWDLTFVDAECDPPMVFSYGGWIGHMIVFQNYRRIALMLGLTQIGVRDLPYCDPVDYKGDGPDSVAPWSLTAS